MKHIYTPPQTAQLLGVKPVTVFRLVAEGQLAAVVVRQGAKRRLLRFTESAIEEFIAASEQRTARRGKHDHKVKEADR